MKVLVTGGAGFIGSHIVDELINRGYTVKVLDNLETQVHGPKKTIPPYLTHRKGVEFIRGDVTNLKHVERALEGVEAVFHEASLVGSGQSLFEAPRYVKVNSFGTAQLLNAIVRRRNKIKKIIVASSQSVYGEGKYLCEKCGVVYPPPRTLQQLEAGLWEVMCPHCQSIVKPLPIDEDKPLAPRSVYGITKRCQEELCLTIGSAWNIPTVVLRYFAVYGPRQSLSNPYAGVCAIFIASILNGIPPVIYEDGLETRDFIHVKDVVQANILALEKSSAQGAYNVGTGKPTSILDVAEILIKKLAVDIRPQIKGIFRPGDMRHGYADISKIKRELGFKPQIKFDDGIDSLIDWLKAQPEKQLCEKLYLFKVEREKGIRSGIVF